MLGKVPMSKFYRISIEIFLSFVRPTKPFFVSALKKNSRHLITRLRCMAYNFTGNITDGTRIKTWRWVSNIHFLKFAKSSDKLSWNFLHNEGYKFIQENWACTLIRAWLCQVNGTKPLCDAWSVVGEFKQRIAVRQLSKRVECMLLCDPIWYGHGKFKKKFLKGEKA